jgi:hypothetical protein
MLDPDHMNTDPKHCFLRERTVSGGFASKPVTMCDFSPSKSDENHRKVRILSPDLDLVIDRK